MWLDVVSTRCSRGPLIRAQCTSAAIRIRLVSLCTLHWPWRVLWLVVIVFQPFLELHCINHVWPLKNHAFNRFSQSFKPHSSRIHLIQAIRPLYVASNVLSHSLIVRRISRAAKCYQETQSLPNQRSSQPSWHRRRPRGQQSYKVDA